MLTPQAAPSCRDHMPVASTTYSAVISPRSVTTPVARPSLVLMLVTAVFSKTRAPPLVAPLTSAMVVSIGLVWPSFGSHTPPTTSSTLSSGHLRLMSAGPITSTSRPKVLAIEAPRRNSSNRSAWVATATLPRCRKPVACPVSFSSVA